MSLSRRKFLRSGGMACLAAAAGAKARGAVRDESVILHPRVEIGTIRPELHGHFSEHLGSCVYGGLWVGRNSSVPHLNGYRKQAVQYLRELGVPVLRWPGGCFADDYHWRDGIGPAEKRPKRVNIHWGNYAEDNSFGTHEFIGLCREIGAEPYLAGNVGSGAPQELRDWVEYCNYPSGSTLAGERAANGSAEPFRVRYWGVGNENWGCGGEMQPAEYAMHYRRYSMYMREFGGVRPLRIACGPNGNDTEWSRRFLEGLGGNRGLWGFAMHFYSGGEDTPRNFTAEHMQEQLSSLARLETAILQQRALLDSFDPKREIGLLVDEWGVWDRMIPEEEKKYGALYQQNTMRSAVAAALGLNVFHRQADKLVMCNIAQTVNVLHSMLLAHEDRCVRTPSYYAFLLNKPHRSGTAIRVETGDPSPLGLSVSASRRGNDLVLTCVNPRHDTVIRLRGVLAQERAVAATARVLSSEDWNTANTFEAPDRVVPRGYPVSAGGPEIRLEVPPMSVVTAELRLG